MVGMPEIKRILEQSVGHDSKSLGPSCYPQVALLNAPIPRIAKHTQKLIALMLLGAKTTITKAWKQPTVSFQEAKRKISWIMSQEKLVSTMTDTTKSFEATWEPWVRHIGISFIPGIQTTRTS